MQRDIRKILFITLSNFGDCIMTLPVLDILMSRYPQAQIVVMSSVQTREIFDGNPRISRFIAYDKHSGLKGNIRQFFELKKEKFDLVVDLRNTFFGAFLPAKMRTSPFLFIPKRIRHMRQRHLYRIKTHTQNIKSAVPQEALFISPEDRKHCESLFKPCGISPGDKIAAVAPGARSLTKRWQKEKFTELVISLRKDFGLKVLLVGGREDAALAAFIRENADPGVIDFTGRTSIPQLAFILKKCEFLVSADSGIMHLASYLDIPVIALFGPTDDEKYGPWSGKSSIVKKEIACRPCKEAQCRFGTLKCMELINTGDVFSAIRNTIDAGFEQAIGAGLFKRILIIRTDRIGDVLLSTPVIKNMRRNYPNSYLAMMVSPETKDLVEGNPYLDEVIVFDKNEKHRNFQQTLRFARQLKNKKFDLAIILHPTNRVHLLTYLAGIPRRVGYNRKLGFLLTDRLAHLKQTGQKHELEYNLDLLKYLGIRAGDKELLMPLKKESEKSVDDLFTREGIAANDKLLVIHPSASCPSRIWPAERFAQVTDNLAQRYGFKVVVVAGVKDAAKTEDVINQMRSSVVNLAGKISISELASVLKRSTLLISNDSGPVHMASALNIPVVSIFSRSQAGLSPQRWGPTGKESKVLHKKVGCIECLAHNCQKKFACLNAITVDEVISAAESLLKK